MHGDMVCSLGWSPAWYSLRSPDGEPVHMVVMYFVPESQKNSYLKEIPSLAGKKERATFFDGSAGR